MALPLGEIPDLPDLLWRLIRQIPAGRVTTYGALAEALGNRIAARWVGYVAMHHDHGPDCLCHRLVRADGQLGRFITEDLSAKARLLGQEGIEVAGDRVDLQRFGFDAFTSDRPLSRLQQVQESIVSEVELRSRSRMPKLLGGVDVSYPGSDEGVAAYALVELQTGRLVWSATVRRRTDFPYITSYLAFRELPILLQLLDEVRRADRLSEVLLVDGSGLLHQRHAGIATHLGVVGGVPTIGVTKRLLCGQVDLEGMKPLESRPVVFEDRPVGVALRATAGSRRPLFISPGNRVDLVFAERLIRRALQGHRLPEPLYWADRLSRQAG